MQKTDATTTAYHRIGVIGAGAWGTALALAAARAGRKVTLWVREPDVLESIRHNGVNARFLPRVPLPAEIESTGELPAATDADALLLAVPAQHVRHLVTRLGAGVLAGKPLVLCAKGIERQTGKLLTEILVETGAAIPGILSGPSFARDVADGLPTAVTIAAPGSVSRRLQSSFAHATFRPYASADLTGTALGGAAKNVYAIGSGIVAGMGLGESAQAALIARSFAEFLRLGRAMGARDETLMGLSGLGDLVLTATSSTSRNFSFGLALGKGTPLTRMLEPGRPLAEGVETAPALVARGSRHGIELPVAEAISDILGGKLTLDSALPRLMLRPHRSE